ncbi:MAG: hypothetical protein R6X19_01720 [Kiritimatiellia bacterium]
MSKQGRTSIILLGLVVAGLLLVPLGYLAFAGRFDRIDQAALDRRIAVLQATTVDTPADLQARFRADVLRTLPILPPDPELKLNPSGGIVVFDPRAFSDWRELMEPSTLNGATVYPVTVAEDPETRDTVFYNEQAVPISVIAPETDYNPFAWLAAHRPEFYASNAVPAARAKAEALYDPARVIVTFYLLPAKDVGDMAEAQLAASSFDQDIGMSMRMGEGLPEPVTNLVIFAIERVTNGIALGIGWPYDFTNKLEVFARTNLAPIGWFVASTNLSTAGTNSQWWVDESFSSNTTARFYCVGNADLDSDEEGLTDARERWIYGTDERYSDSDMDDLSDWAELFEAGTDPWNPDSDNDGVPDGEDQYPLIHGPVIVVSDPDGNQTLTQSVISVTGTVSNEMTLSAIRVNSEPVSQQSTPTNGIVCFSHSLTFEEGLREITVAASATNGSGSLVRFYVTINATPPSVKIIQPTEHQVFTNQNIRVVVESDSNYATITINEQCTISQGFLYSAWLTLEGGTNLICARSVESGQALTNMVYAVCDISTNYPEEDADSDSVLNQNDCFPNDPAEWDDTDADGVGDNADPDPDDPSISSTITIDQPENGITIRGR